MALPQKEKGSVGLNIEYGVPNFKWQMAFNWFSLEKVSQGCLMKAAYVTNNTAAEIVPIIISHEGITQLKGTVKDYISSFGDVPPRQSAGLQGVRQFTPLFCNHLRISYAGHSGEIAFFTVVLHDIANAARGVLKAQSKIPAVQVALLHSDITTHQQLVLELTNFK